MTCDYIQLNVYYNALRDYRSGRIRFTVWLVSGYAVVLPVVINTLRFESIIIMHDECETNINQEVKK